MSMTDGTKPANQNAVAIRDARTGDLAGIQTIYAHHVLTGIASFEEVPPTLDEMARRHATITGAGYPYIVAERAGAIAGYAYVGPYRARPAYRFSVENSVYVADGLAGLGIGKALMTELIARCEAGPWRQMIAVIGDSANAGSIGLHRSAGFEPIGVMRAVGFKHGRWVDSVLMQRSLGAGDTVPPG